MPGMPGMGGAETGAFPAPGVTDTTPTGTDTTTPRQSEATSPPAMNPFAMFGNPVNNEAFGGAAGNPFAALLAGAGASPFAPPPANRDAPPPQAGETAATHPFLANNPFLQNPQAMQQMLAAMSNMPGVGPSASGAGAGAMNPFAAALADMGGMGGAPAAPADTRPPEERYAEQLRQLNDMGFYEFERNIEALRRSGGSVPGAVEYLLTH